MFLRDSFIDGNKKMEYLLINVRLGVTSLTRS